MSGVELDMPHETYLRHPALSASGAKKLLPPSCPAIFRHERDHGQPVRDTRAFDLGHAVHASVLGIGADTVVVDAEDWRTKAAKQAAEAARTEGKVPLLRAEAEQVAGMVEQVHAHPVAGALFNPDRGGWPEASLFWHDTRHGVDRRARVDWLPEHHGRRLIVPDLKSAVSSEPAAFAKAVANYGYDMQARWYLDAIEALGLAADAVFVFVVVEKTPPYVVSVFELDAAWLRIGRARVDQALETFAECTATDTWPGYTDDVELLTPPAWVTRQHEGAL